MIQRIQTIFLLIVTIVSVTLMFLPFVQYDITPVAVRVALLPSGNSELLTGLYYIPVVLNILILLFSIFVIMQFRKRIVQMKLANLLMALSGILLGVMLLFDFVKPELAGPQLVKHYLAGAFLPILSVIVSFLAARAIKKDEELVRSSDRLR